MNDALKITHAPVNLIAITQSCGSYHAFIGIIRDHYTNKRYSSISSHSLAVHVVAEVLASGAAGAGMLSAGAVVSCAATGAVLSEVGAIFTGSEAVTTDSGTASAGCRTVSSVIVEIGSIVASAASGTSEVGAVSTAALAGPSRLSGSSGTEYAIDPPDPSAPLSCLGASSLSNGF